MLDCTSTRTHLPSHHSRKSLRSRSPTPRCLPHSPALLPGWNSQGPGPSGRAQSACLCVGSCRGKSEPHPRGPSASHTADPAQASESHNQGPTNTLPETQHPICKLRIPQADSESIFLPDREQSPLAPTTFPHPPHFKIGI